MASHRRSRRLTRLARPPVRRPASAISGRRGALALSLVLLGCMLAPVAAHAELGVGISSSISSTLTVGTTNVPASIVVTNLNTAPDGALTLCNSTDAGPCTGSEGITLLPSCGGQDFRLLCNAFDPGVFSIDTPAFGAAGSACQGQEFTVAVADAPSGKVRFTPTVGHVQLQAPGSACRIDFSVDVLSLPDIDWAPITAGKQTVQIAETLALSNQSLVFKSTPSGGVTVKAAPPITTTASPGVPIGGSVTDTATLHGEYNPASGGVTFSLYGPGDTTCAGTPVFTSSVAIDADGTATSGAHTPGAAGTYRWIASYAGDAVNNAAAGACNDADETVVIAKASPSIATTPSPGVAIGGQVTASATLGAEHNPATGDVTFRLYGTGDTTCSDAPSFSSTVSVAADGNATSGPSTPNVAGTYRWVASYTGDANNDPATGACNAGGAVVIAKATPSIATTASAGVTIGGQVTDSASLVGAHHPAAGNVTFRLYGPSDAGCSSLPAFSSTVAIEPDGSVTSAPYTPLATGTYRWIATYAGDANNASADAACNAADETVVIAKASPTIGTIASLGVAIGGQVTASATLAGAHKPTAGSVTFRLYGPGDLTCSGTPLTSTVSIGADGTAASGALTPPAPGTYRWIAAYAGDESNDAASSACNAPPASVTVTKATPSIVTSASATVALEGQVTDSSTLTGRYGSTSGNVTFRLYGPADATCAGAAEFASTVAIGADGKATSAPFTPAAPGVYRWTASYEGDANNERADGACNDPGESVTVTKRSPAMTTNASPGRTIGGQVTDSATLVGEHNATAGSVTFSLYGPGDGACSGAAAFSSTVPIASDGTATSEQFTPSIAGTYRWIATYGGDANNASAAGSCNDAGETVAMAKATPSILTTASADVTIGGKVTDSATLAGEHNPTAGSVTFRLYGPADAACSGSPAFTASSAIDADGTVTSSEFTPTVVGTYRWIASYGGDASNEAAAGACNAAGETVTVKRRASVLQSNASAPVAVGGTITDSATLTNVLNPTGEVTFLLYGPGDETCAGAPLRASTVAVGSGASATSAPYATSAPGTYRWVASYGGDANHDAAAGACNDPNESVTVTRARPSIATNASDAVAVGGHVTDSATLEGEFGPTTGNVTFRLYGPQDAACSAAAVFQSTVSIAGDGSAMSQGFSPSAPGTYRWVASYAGDGHNEAASGACNDPDESVTVAKASPSMATNASPAVAVGGTITDSATLGGEFGPTQGSVTFRLYAPGDASCSGAAAFESTVAIAADGTATSAPFAARAAGTYHWIASYGGDGANAPASGACNDPGETVVVGTASPTIDTNASADVDAGGAVSDTAALDGEVNPTTGSVTFRLFGPEDASCERAAVFQSRVSIRADGTATSASFVPTAPGTYRWVAGYSGDKNNRAAIGACNDAGESVVVRVAASPLLCGGTQIALVDVFPEGSRMIISGVAQPSLAGKRARIVRESTTKTVVSARIGANGAFAASVALPAKRLRAGARYRAIVDRSRSAALKLERRSYLTRAAVRGNKATFRGRVTGAFKTGEKVTLLQITLCTKNTAIAATKLSRSGRWQITIPLPANGMDVLFRAKTNVLRDARRHQTFTLPSPLSLSSAPSR